MLQATLLLRWDYSVKLHRSLVSSRRPQSRVLEQRVYVEACLPSDFSNVQLALLLRSHFLAKLAWVVGRLKTHLFNALVDHISVHDYGMLLTETHSTGDCLQENQRRI